MLVLGHTLRATVLALIHKHPEGPLRGPRPRMERHGNGGGLLLHRVVRAEAQCCWGRSDSIILDKVREGWGPSLPLPFLWRNAGVISGWL